MMGEGVENGVLRICSGNKSEGLLEIEIYKITSCF